MKKVVVASKNPVKIQCSRQALEQVFPNDTFEFIGISVPSGVSDQPMTDQETLLGAKNRVDNARSERPDGDFWIGIEGGISVDDTEMTAFAWVVICDKNRSGKARTATFELPAAVSKLVKQGVELGHADDIVFKRDNSKQKNGAVGILTHDLIDRAGYYQPAVTLALIPFLNPELY